MGKKPDQPPIDLSAKRATSARNVESSAPPAATIPAATIPAATISISQAPIATIPIASTSVVTAPVENKCATACAAPSEEAIRVGAYYRWDAAGRPGGDGIQFWLQAEQELLTGGAKVTQESCQSR